MLNIPLNRVEGDLELRAEIRDGAVAEAWSSGTMYRGFENILKGRGALDGLVITPRICGICSTTHLTAAARALDEVTNASVPDNALRVRNVTLMAEHIQSDIRHGFLLFAPDFVNAAYKDNALYEEAVRRYAPLRGETAIGAIRITKKILEIVAILGGQWPHSSFMVPGGVTTVPGAGDLVQCQNLLKIFRQWYEQHILGCTLDHWNAIDSISALDTWLAESASQHDSDVGFFIRYARSIGLDQIGRGYGNFLSYGSFDLPQETAVKPIGQRSPRKLMPDGFISAMRLQSFDQAKIAEHVAYSWTADYAGGKHPWQGETRPYASGSEGKKYSWAKAPRYDGLPAETGPLAEMLISANPLFADLVRSTGATVFVRELARLARPAILIPAMETWLKELIESKSSFYEKPAIIDNGQAAGLIEAARGALGHWITIEDGKIAHYQIITPTAWNGSPRDSNDARGPWEEALIGTPVRDPDNPIEVGLVIRSFDACLVCAVHTIKI
jgi:hydrogenase large subunit